MKNSEAYRLYTTLESARKEKKEKVSRKEEKKETKKKELSQETLRNWFQFTFVF